MADDEDEGNDGEEEDEDEDEDEDKAAAEAAAAKWMGAEVTRRSQSDSPMSFESSSFQSLHVCAALAIDSMGSAPSTSHCICSSK